MQKMTLLDMTQNILSAMNSDNVNSIGDTVESLQVAEEIRTAFFNLFTNRDIPELEGLVHLESLNDASKPHIMRVPDTIALIKWIKYYDYRNDRLVDVEYLTPEEFITKVMQGFSLTSNVQAVTFTDDSTLTFNIKTNSAPSFYTVFEGDGILVFDSFDTDNESYLTDSSVLAWGVKNKVFTMQDDFVPPLDANLFPLLLAEAKSAAFINVKEVSNAKEEQRARRQLVRSQIRTNRTIDQRRGVFSGTDFSRQRGYRGSYRRKNSR